MLKSFEIQCLLKLLSLIFAMTVLLLHCVFAEYASSCITPENETGKCMPVKSCAKAYSMIKILMNSDSFVDFNTSSAVQTLRQSQCDYKNDTVYVCCPTTEIQINPDIYAHLSQLNCGISSNRKIAHGERADINAYRWSALLIYDGNNKFRCGGSLINERYVLTAAHCFLGFEENPIAVRLGEYDLSTELDCINTKKGRKCLDPYEDISIETAFIHEEYVFRGLHHDIALLRLSRVVEFKKNMLPVCLPITKELQAQHAEWYLVAGWGHTENGTSSNVLLYTSIPYQTREFCKQKLRLSRTQKLTEGHICAGGDRFRDSCKGDSGGALFLPDIYTDGVARSIQYGIVSLGVSTCGEITAPAIYTNVSHYMQWITDHMLLD